MVRTATGEPGGIKQKCMVPEYPDVGEWSLILAHPLQSVILGILHIDEMDESFVSNMVWTRSWRPLIDLYSDQLTSCLRGNMSPRTLLY